MTFTHVEPSVLPAADIEKKLFYKAKAYLLATLQLYMKHLWMTYTTIQSSRF